MCNSRYERKLEKQFTHSPYIAEFFNTISNLPFILIAFCRIYEGTPLLDLYTLLIIIGVCSAIHHATTSKYTIIVDYAPIILSIYYFHSHNYYFCLTPTNYFEITLALFFLITDHVYTIIPVPWGHVLWHVVAAYTIDTVYFTVSEHGIFKYV